MNDSTKKILSIFDHISPDATPAGVSNETSTPAPRTPEPLLTPREAVNRKYADTPGRQHYGDTYQNGVKPGRRKLRQFREVMALMNVPDLYSTENTPCEEKMVYVKLFNPCGAHTWLISEFDPESNLAFIYTGNSQWGEWGSLDLQEVSETPGPMGIGIEIDMHFTPLPFPEAKAQEFRA